MKTPVASFTKTDFRLQNYWLYGSVLSVSNVFYAFMNVQVTTGNIVEPQLAQIIVLKAAANLYACTSQTNHRINTVKQY